MPVSEGTLRLIQRRNHVDEKFLDYARPEKLSGNFESLAHLALIGGRLDTIIRRKLAEERGKARRE